MRTDKEIEVKIEELLDEDNFTELDIDYVDGSSELRFDDGVTKKTLKMFSEWLLEKDENNKIDPAPPLRRFPGVM